MNNGVAIDKFEPKPLKPRINADDRGSNWTRTKRYYPRFSAHIRGQGVFLPIRIISEIRGCPATNRELASSAWSNSDPLSKIKIYHRRAPRCVFAGANATHQTGENLRQTESPHPHSYKRKADQSVSKALRILGGWPRYRDVTGPLTVHARRIDYPK
jgi:hypothetical protein